MATTLQDLIYAKISLGKQSSSGFYSVRCPCCNDYKSRGGWRITHNEIFYNCFNCGIKSGYEINDNKPISKKLIKILKDFGISEQEINQVKGTMFFNKTEEPKVITIENIQKINTFTPEVNLPEGSVRVDGPNCPSDVYDKISAYLAKRKIDISSYIFYHSDEHRYKNRVIIPYYRNDKIIYWQARSLDANDKVRYLNCEVPKASVLFNIDELFRHHSKPLFVVEGVFDAIHLNGVGLLGSSLTEQKIEMLRRSKRELIFVIDKDGPGKELGHHVLREKLGSITFAPGSGDVNDSIIEAGKIWTVYSLLKERTDRESLAKLKLNSIRDKNVRFGKTKDFN